MESQASGIVFNIMRYSVHDGPGIRTTVFLKGCPLNCWWCHNPESQDFRPRLMFFEERCRRCGECVAACPNGAIARPEDSASLIEVCQACGACVDVCVAGAREIAGRRITVAEALAEIERDVIFFDESGGGVTLSGGEPLCQPEFAEALLGACRARRIHTVLDTCGFAQRDTVLRVARQADLVLYDLKLLDSARHVQYTGVSNIQILTNLEALVVAGANVIARFPLIPAVNDAGDDILAIARFLSRIGLRRVDLLPYHRIGQDKYRRLGISSKLDGFPVPSAAQIEEAAAVFRQESLSVRIGG